MLASVGWRWSTSVHWSISRFDYVHLQYNTNGITSQILFWEQKNYSPGGNTSLYITMLLSLCLCLTFALSWASLKRAFLLAWKKFNPSFARKKPPWKQSMIENQSNTVVKWKTFNLQSQNKLYVLSHKNMSYFMLEVGTVWQQLPFPMTRAILERIISVLCFRCFNNVRVARIIKFPWQQGCK